MRQKKGLYNAFHDPGTKRFPLVIFVLVFQLGTWRFHIWVTRAGRSRCGSLRGSPS